MKAITIRGIDGDLDSALRRRAKDSETSVNATILKILREYLGLRKRRFAVVHHDLDHLAGGWTEEEKKAFDEAVSAFSEIDAEMWR